MDPQLAVLGYARLCLDVLTLKLPKMDFKYSRHVSIILHSGLAGRAPIPAPVPPPSECVIYFFQKLCLRVWTLISKKRRQKEKESRCHVDGVELRNTCPRVRIAEARHFAFLCRRFSNDSITTIRSARALDNVCRILDEARHGQHLKWACSCQQPAADRERISLWHVQVYERMNIRNMFFPRTFPSVQHRAA